MEKDEAKEIFLEANKISQEIILSEPENDEAYVEAAHSIGRYSQNIGIMSALTQGLAERVSKNLNRAIEINNENILAHISKGTWHAEIVNKAGAFMAKALYKALPEHARNHYTKAKLLLKSNSQSILSPIAAYYEIAYGYSLLEEDEDIKEAKRLLHKALELDSNFHIDQIYIRDHIFFENKEQLLSFLHILYTEKE